MKLIVFDLYNTLIEITNYQYVFKKIHKATSDRFGLSRAAYRHLLITKPMDEVKAILPSSFAQQLKENKVSLETELQSIQLFPETKTILSQLSRQYKLCLVSNLSTPYKAPFYSLGLDAFFEQTFFSCDCRLMKPDEALFKMVETHFELNCKDILMIGDSYKSDVKGAKSRKWRYLRVNRNSSHLNTFEISNLAQIPTHLDRITTS